MERCASRIVSREVKGKPWHFATHAGSLAVAIERSRAGTAASQDSDPLAPSPMLGID